MRTYYVYVATNKNNMVLYTGITSNLERRILEHIWKRKPTSFTAKYNVNKLVYCETFNNPQDAIRAEKKIKGWTRKKKVKLIESINPQWKDLLLE